MLDVTDNYADPFGKTIGCEDVVSKIDVCREHYKKVGLGGGYVDQFAR